ncbi:MAG: universal stress protein [Kofleriaceae bacterium]
MLPISHRSSPTRPATPLTAPAGASRGPALLAFAGTPDDQALTTMVACAANLGRATVTAAVGTSAAAVIATEQEISDVAAEVTRTGAAVVVVDGLTVPRVVRRLAAVTRRPVLLARTRQPWKTVLTATDLRPAGLPVLAAGAAVAAASDAASMILHNVAPLWIGPARAVLVSGPRTVGIERRLRRLARAAARATPQATVLIANTGTPAQAIVDASVARDADLLVVGMRRPRRLRAGRCADTVVATSPTNVMVVPVTGTRRLARHDAAAGTRGPQ